MIDKRLLREAVDSRIKLAILIGLGLAGGIFAVLQANYLSKIINGAFLEARDVSSMYNWFAMFLAVIAARAVTAYAAELSAQSLAVCIKRQVRQRLIKHLFALGPIKIGSEQSGDLVNIVVQGVDNLEAYFTRYIPQLATAALIPVLVLAVVFPLDLMSAIILFGTAPLIPVFMVLIGRLAQRLNERQWERLTQLSAHFLDVISGLTTLKIFGRSKEQIKVIARLSDQFRDTTLGVLKVAFLSSLVLELVTTISIAIVAVTIGLRLLYGQMEFAQAFFLLLLAPEFYLPLRQLGSHFHAGMAGTSAAQSIYRLLDMPAEHNGINSGNPFKNQCEIKIDFKDVYYDYDSGNRPALNRLSFSLFPGSRVALVGPSGAGKSTVINLLLGFIRPQQGNIFINGMNLSCVSREDWLNHIAYVPQFPHLFYGTVADNIKLGRDKASLEEISAAAKASGAHDFICCLPEGYQTVVGEGGYGLSGGEIQRVAIARAFLRNAPLLILDEATASLDPHSEAIVAEALDRLMAGRTVLVIAHRLTTVTKSDVIFVLNNGQAVETGTHAELTRKKGLYAQMVSALQNGV